MTLATVRVVVSKELSTSHDCCLNQHGYIRSRQTSLGRVSIHTHTVGSRQSSLCLAPFTSSVSCQHTYAVTGPPAHKWKAARIFIPSLAVSSELWVSVGAQPRIWSCRRCPRMASQLGLLL